MALPFTGMGKTSGEACCKGSNNELSFGFVSSPSGILSRQLGIHEVCISVQVAGDISLLSLA